LNNDPIRIGGTLSALARSWGFESPIETARLFSAWGQIVGPEVAARCRPSSLKGGVLKVRTESAVWASEFRYLSADVIRRINSELGKEIVREIKPWVKPGVGENEAMPNRSLQAKPATSRGSALMAREAAEIARGIKDPQLADALAKAVLAARNSQGAGA
jgi:predicted nucleic acid-binding Zn ribbon protein